MHTCHLDICERLVAPKYLFCRPHWNMVPRLIQAAVWNTYRPGQENDKQPSAAYLQVQRQARMAVLQILAQRDVDGAQAALERLRGTPDH